MKLGQQLWQDGPLSIGVVQGVLLLASVLSLLDPFGLAVAYHFERLYRNEDLYKVSILRPVPSSAFPQNLDLGGFLSNEAQTDGAYKASSRQSRGRWHRTAGWYKVNRY